MSWQDYVNKLVMSGHLDSAAIISVAGDSIWAASEDLKLLSDETETLSLLLAADGSGDVVENAHAKGIHVATRIEDRRVHGRQGRTGVCAVKTKVAIIVGHYGAKQLAGSATKEVEALADHFISLNY